MMKKNFAIFMLASICLLSAHAQRSCKDCIQDLYKVVEGAQLDSISIGHSFYSVKSLYQGKGLLLEQSQKPECSVTATR